MNSLERLTRQSCHSGFLIFPIPRPCSEGSKAKLALGLQLKRLLQAFGMCFLPLLPCHKLVVLFTAPPSSKREAFASLFIAFALSTLSRLFTSLFLYLLCRSHACSPLELSKVSKTCICHSGLTGGAYAGCEAATLRRLPLRKTSRMQCQRRKCEDHSDACFIIFCLCSSRAHK